MATSTLRSKKPSNISRTKNVALKLLKISLTKGYFGQFKGYFGQFKGYIFAVLGHFCFLLRLGGCGSQGLYNRSKEKGGKRGGGGGGVDAGKGSGAFLGGGVLNIYFEG